ncbi:MAG: hypothetical protein RQ826_16655 [Xanthomonadales bacterium]|nr:hypothetical protein [Xanthomonadales bacterium]
MKKLNTRNMNCPSIPALKSSDGPETSRVAYETPFVNALRLQLVTQAGSTGSGDLGSGEPQDGDQL